jgi:hypothetical protein
MHLFERKKGALGGEENGRKKKEKRKEKDFGRQK